ncbi:MAG: hypothetical protein ACREK4_00010 [Candidatus Rokuibacteriota bacterium]
MTYTTDKFTTDELGFIQTAAAKILAAVEELANWGLDQNGTWVGFDQARSIHNV